MNAKSVQKERAKETEEKVHRDRERHSCNGSKIKSEGGSEVIEDAKG